MTDQKHVDWRKEWDEAEARVRAKPKQLRLDKRPARKVAVKPIYNLEHCDGCSLLLPRGHLKTVQVEENGRFPSAYKFLCSACRQPEALEAVRAEKNG